MVNAINDRLFSNQLTVIYQKKKPHNNIWVDEQNTFGSSYIKKVNLQNFPCRMNFQRSQIYLFLESQINVEQERQRGKDLTFAGSLPKWPEISENIDLR